MFGIVACGNMTDSFFHLYLARSLVFVDWEVESIPPGFEMVRQLMLYYYHRNLEALPQSKRKGIPNLPSWAPDWSVEAATNSIRGSKIELTLPSRVNASASLSHVESQSTL
jgi:hypothetical protein